MPKGFPAPSRSQEFINFEKRIRQISQHLNSAINQQTIDKARDDLFMFYRDIGDAVLNDTIDQFEVSELLGLVSFFHLAIDLKKS